MNLAPYVRCDPRGMPARPSGSGRMVLAVAILLLSLAGEGFGASYDATGIWKYTTSGHWATSLDCLEQMRTEEVALIQNGDTFTYTSDAGIHTGRVSGSDYSSRISYPEDGGTTVSTIDFALSSATRAVGSAVWTWTDGFFSCSGGNDMILFKMPADAEYDASGLWGVTGQTQWSTCGDGGAVLNGNAAISQDGNRFRIAGYNGTQIGVLSGHIYVGMASYTDGDVFGIDSIKLSLTGVDRGLGFVDWYVTDGASECWGSDFLEFTRRTTVMNSPPSAPTPIRPKDGERTTLDPILVVGPFLDPDPDSSHGGTEWQVSTDSAFSTTVFSQVGRDVLFRLRIPHYVLKGDTEYFWRARFYDDNDRASAWSETAAFRTRIVLRDLNEDGVPDDQEISLLVDLDRDGTPDRNQPFMTTVRSAVKAGYMGVNVENADRVTAVNFAESIDPASLSGIARPYSMPLGLFGMELEMKNPLDEAEVIVHFSEPAPPGAKWLVYDATRGWIDFSRLAAFSADRQSVRLKLKDWGYGDNDGLANGKIADPGGFGLASWLQGTVKDAATGKPLPGATVTVQDVELDCTAEGAYVSVMLPGTYTVSATAPGYKTASRSGVTVPEGGVASVDLSLTSDTGETAPAPNIRINGSDGPVDIPAGSDIRLELGLYSGSFSGAGGDWWIVAVGPQGYTYLSLAPFSWTDWPDSLPPTFQSPLFDFSGIELAGIPGFPTTPGEYWIFFAVDRDENGIIDETLTFDYVVIELK